MSRWEDKILLRAAAGLVLTLAVLAWIYVIEPVFKAWWPVVAGWVGL